MGDSLKDKAIVVTGASKGMGEVFAESFLREGARVASLARSKHENPKVFSILCDVVDFHQVNEAFEKVFEKFGGVDVLLNNAGTQGEIASVSQSNPENWLRAVHVNLFGTYYCTRCVLPRMIQRKTGKIINMSGGGATGPRPYFSAYAASKAAVVRFTETLAKEVQADGVTVNAVAPGAINTQMLDEVLNSKKNLSQEVYQEACKQKEKGGCSLDKVVELALFLSSDESKDISGRLISAQHDDFRNMKPVDTDWFTLRRVDPYLFTLKR